MSCSVVSVAIHVQLRELEAACDGPLEAMARISWSTITTVSGPSPYVTDLVRGIEQVAAIIDPLIEQKKYLRNFYDKAAS